jgi:hypothetical protein
MIMARAKKVEKPPQELFAESYIKYAELPAGHNAAFKGQNPDAPASAYQKAILEKMGIGTDGITMKGAHCSMQAYGDLYPGNAAAIWKEQADAQNARKATAKGAPAAAGTPAKAAGNFTKYTVSKTDVNKPATYTQLVQLKEGGLRKFSDDKIPTRGEVADALNKLQSADKAKYDTAMSKANDTVAQWKHQAPSAKQVEFAESCGIKVTEFKPADGAAPQSGSTAFSVGEKIHTFRCNNPEAYAEAKAASAAMYPAKDAAQASAVDITAKIEAGATKAAAQAQAGAARKAGGVPALQVFGAAAERTAQAEVGG